ncbi:hypothetical protein [Salmonirosea aquatica]|uniref:Outer membrane beta-barrel protein n=1 Tax=Salmonirosea aquatica TaxID=2654236 RepID=A0A7C9F903_9BACT|nr:hypothetical protein [Cytophagaceae bacterium SJW1-29]
MKEWSDEELDKLFQKSAEELDPPYEPADWQNLRRRLDEADGITPGGGWLKKTLPWLVLELLLLIGGLGVYYGIGDNEGNGASSVSGTRPADRLPAEVPSTPRAEAPHVPAEGTVSELEKRDQETNSQSADSPEVRKKDQARTGTEVADIESKAAKDLKELPRNLASVSGVREQSNQSEQERGEGAILLPKTTPNAKLEISADPNRRRSHVGPSATFGREEAARQVPSQERLQPMPGQEENNPAGESQTERASRERWLRVAPLDSRENYQESRGLTYPRVAFTSPPDSLSGQNAAETPTIQIPKWSIRLGISPDLSAVRMSDMMHPMQPGPSASLLVERSISNKWTLQTGIVRSLKKYSAPFSDYHPDKHLYQTTLPVSVDGTCTVFEVPLNVRFDVFQSQKTRWFAGAGVSSYKMQKENYIYNYATYVHNAAKGWGPNGTGWYLLSHANASMGYERRLSSRLSLVAEPYLRIPLRGVGFGKVNLFTGGVWLSARYTPIFRK